PAGFTIPHPSRLTDSAWGSPTSQFPRRVCRHSGSTTSLPSRTTSFSSAEKPDCCIIPRVKNTHEMIRILETEIVLFWTLDIMYLHIFFLTFSNVIHTGESVHEFIRNYLHINGTINI